MKNLVDLSGKKILITGASSGIGRACAIMTSELGASVVLLGRRIEALTETLGLMQNCAAHKIISGDLTDSVFVASVLEIIGKIDGFVHSAGIAPMMPVSMIDEAFLSSVFKTNYVSFLSFMRLFSKAKNRNPGFSAVVISSVSASAGWAGGTAYCGSKGALSASVRAMAVELASKGIRVNAVSPSNIKTPLYDAGAADMNDEQAIQKLISKQPLGLGEPEQVASVVCFLLSEASSFITGADIPVDGGYLAL